eukprot:c10063_g1_i1 orf=185-2881(-)
MAATPIAALVAAPAAAPRQLLSGAKPAPPVGVAMHGTSRGASGQRGGGTCASVRHMAVRCQAFPSFTKQKAGTGAEVEDLVATAKVLKEGAFDVASHALSVLLGNKVKMFLVSTELHPETKEPKISPKADLLFTNKESKDVGQDSWIQLKFAKVPKDFGKPVALLVESYDENEFFLKSVTLESPTLSTAIHFPCHSWIDHIKHNSGHPRIFFTNQAFLPKMTPEALVKLREEELVLLRGNGEGQRKKPERIYDYDVYNDLGSPDKSKDLKRPTLGGSSDLPYPRRCRTGRERCSSDKSAEEPVFFDDGYVPRDERFSPLKMTLFLAASVKCFGQNVLPILRDIVDASDHFSDFDEVYELYEGSLRSIRTPKFKLKNPTNGSLITFPPPGVVQGNKESWRNDGEFGRQRLAGSNPLCIELLKEFPIKSKLDPKEYGPSSSSITDKQLERYLEGMKVDEAIEKKKLFVLNYHDAIMPYVSKINKEEGKLYASRTIFYLSRFGILLPVAIELSLPPAKKGEKGVSRVFTPPPGGLPDWEWRLAKTHVAALDSGIHQLISHWLRTHACVEPFIISTHRNLSTMHPIHVLLSPHFKDTMNINAMARTSLINAGGIIEKGFTPGKYSLEISSIFYKDWRFDEQSLPKDLLKRGMAVEDPTSKHGVKLVIEDYPYAVDGLEIWGAIKDYVRDYVGIYYKGDEDVEGDVELQAWWREIKEVGHGDHKGAKWWGEMKTVEELVEALTIIIWVPSGHHAAVNFGQYAYAGFMPNSPTITKRLIPEVGTKEYAELLSDPERFFLSSVSSQGQATLIMATVEILAQHLGEEEYLGHRNDPQWTSDPRALDALQRFSEALHTVEAKVEERNAAAHSLRHRAGPVFLPYTLLAPLPGGEGLTFRGVPNSISI